MGSSKLAQHTDIWVRIALVVGVVTLVGGALWKQRALIAQVMHERYAGLWGSIQHKVDEIQELETENERLQRLALQLKRKVASLEFRFEEEESRRLTAEMKAALLEETGSPIGRTPKQISFQPPEDLTNGQLFALGLRYFNSGENEKAAMIFKQLAESADPQFATPRIKVLAGISWYRLKNYKLADRYFSGVLPAVEADDRSSEAAERSVASAQEVAADVLRYQAQARLWKGLVARALGREQEAQQWFEQLIDHHPHSKEAQWVNHSEKSGQHGMPDLAQQHEKAEPETHPEPQAVKRAPAASQGNSHHEPKKESHHEPHHESHH